MAKLLKFDDEARAKLLAGVNTVARAVGATLGPKGSNVAIDRQWDAPLVVHDGVTVSKEVDLVDPYENMGAQLIQEAAQKTNDAAGDGTTTATILAQAIVSEAHKVIAAGANAMMVRKGIELAVEAMVARLKEMAKPVTTPEEIEQIAVISAQDPQIGKLVAAAINKLGREAVIAVEESGTTSITVDYKEGMEFDRGFVSPYFVTDSMLNEATVAEAYILITDHKISTMSDLAGFLKNFEGSTEKRQGYGLVFITGGITGQPLAFLIANNIRQNVKLLAIDAPSGNQQAILQDIATVTGGRFISKEAGDTLDKVEIADLGFADRITSTKSSTIIVNGGGEKDAVKKRAENLRAELDKTTGEYDRERLQERIAKLTAGIAVVNVGANSKTEMREKKERCIDAISATKSAIEEGIVPGGETALLAASEALDDVVSDALDITMGVNVVRAAAKQPFNRLVTNAGLDAGECRLRIQGYPNGYGLDVISGEVCDLVASGIIDPVKVTRSALENAASAATMILTTSVLITPDPEAKDKSNE